jgi:hypothetical protein
MCSTSLAVSLYRANEGQLLSWPRSRGVAGSCPALRPGASSGQRAREFEQPRRAAARRARPADLSGGDPGLWHIRDWRCVRTGGIPCEENRPMATRGHRNPPARAVHGYIRVSRVQGRRGASFISPAIQRDQLAAWASAHGVELLEVFEEATRRPDHPRQARLRAQPPACRCRRCLTRAARSRRPRTPHWRGDRRRSRTRAPCGERSAPPTR